jgi:hypothetical protein
MKTITITPKTPKKEEKKTKSVVYLFEVRATVSKEDKFPSSDEVKEDIFRALNGGNFPLFEVSTMDFDYEAQDADFEDEDSDDEED